MRNLKKYLSSSIEEDLITQTGLWMITRAKKLLANSSGLYLIHGCDSTINSKNDEWGLAGKTHECYDCGFCGEVPPESILVTFNLLV